ncbi:MAG: hypothetical protein IKY27_03510 [Bacteroidales bacterium]|nr:hypothetical protein [Bacteroidales bacterium]MBR5781032.1 hypothetical protein [Bacteroidales bacterium]
MKRLIAKLSFIIVAFMAVTFMSCGSEYPNEGYFTVGETTYTVNDAKLEDLGFENGYYQLRLVLDNTENNDSHSINFLVYSEVNTYLPSGLYVPYMYDDQYNHKIKRAAWVVGDEIEGVIWAGFMRVSKSDEIYTIRFDCQDMNDNDITGYYNGEMRVMI